MLRKSIFILPTNPTKTGAYSGGKEVHIYIANEPHLNRGCTQVLRKGVFILPTNPTKTGAYSGAKEGYIYIANEPH